MRIVVVGKYHDTIVTHRAKSVAMVDTQIRVNTQMRTQTLQFAGSRPTTTHILGASNKDVSTDGSNEDSGVASSAAISGVVIGIVAVAVAMAALTIVLRRRHGNNPTSKIGRQTAELYNLLLKRVQAEFLLGMS